ncbi:MULTISPECIES: hypothetical protein [unclassified Streptomyces]|uniref:hypothetical protein n=1 Tax=unclassified Streptomyces TaxID=2593676 RepID=UPI002E287D99|nr:hypothetical protein [Streptomyces sp. NBC_00223]
MPGRAGVPGRPAGADPDRDPSRIDCDGPVTVGRVYTDPATQSLAVRIRGGSAAWKIAIVSGAHDL